MEVEAAPRLYFDPPKNNVTNITFPKEFKALIFDIYMCFLEEKPDNILDFIIRYFETMKEECGTTKLSCSGPEVALAEFVDLDEKYFETRRGAVFNPTNYPKSRLQDIDVISKLQEEKHHLLGVLKKIVFLKDLEGGTIDLLLDALQFRKYYEGEYVIVEDEEMNNFFIVDYGRFAAVKSTEDGECKTVKRYKPGNYFGMQAFFHSRPASFSVITTSAFGTLWTISSKIFRNLVLNREYLKYMDYTSYINSRNVLYVLSEDERYQIIDILDIRTYPDEKTIFSEGDLGDGMFIIIKGKVQFTVLSHGIGPPQEIIACRASQGAHFGELSLVYPCKRALTATAVGETRALYISSEKFQRLLPNRIKTIRKSIHLNPNPVFRVYQVDCAYNDEWNVNS
ncbi:cAMP-dependent protein kinase type II-alpha regulatory subunit-like [Cimex lectularius]|uniref:Cyclic nucleotide-binding domain-containing protein n=1 Tax=Cimex lectularius TaxID=79782 RepID=A0A8I6SN58_CIMLE|nr:cAMP-dependent protein kinase type II-alpha regulatory subunit-like [Cimex lectularius]